ncbi:glycosyltransferase family 2 protein [Piscinibacter sp.]|uniref:glycosyltransferase family 2 protein n=1 Tax=Piscinibacter sp. TaxID=1903157 RepID=UPI002BF02A0E|nr:glycosyltransferase [Albitalea sp.]HUG21937.1 glycosyltransferase [Albitalea sp.]
MFSILIPSWNNLDYLRLCVDSIRKNSVHRHQVIVHVNDGSDGTREWVQQSGVDVTFTETNVGICWAVNEAAMLAEHDYIVYLNDDMYCLPGWDSALLDRLKPLTTDLYMLSGTMVEPRDSGNPCVVVGDYGDTVASFCEADLLRDAPRLRRGDWAGATWPPTLVHRNWWFKSGGYSTELSPGMSSDNDFSMKLWHAGCRHFIGAGDSLVYHFQCKSTGKVVKNDGRRQFLDKWHMTQSTFDKFHLRRGAAWTGGALPEPEDTAAYRWALRKAALKRRFG